MPHTHGPIQEEYHKKMNLLAKELDVLFNGDDKGQHRKIGFMLLVFPFGDEGRVNYISNGIREDCIVAMKEFIARAEGCHFEHKGKQ